MYDVLLINAVLYVLTFLYVIKKYKELNLYVLIWMLYTIVAVAGYVTVKLGFHYSTNTSVGTTLSWVPYLFTYISVCLVSFPFTRLNPKLINIGALYKIQGLKYFIDLCLILFVCVSVLKGSEAVFVLQMGGLGEAYLSNMLDGASLFEYQNRFLRILAGRCYQFCLTVYPVLVIYYISKYCNKAWKKVDTIYLLIAFLPLILGALSAGSKGTLFFAFFDIVFFFLISKHLLSGKVKKLSIVVGVSLLLMLTLISYLINDSRIEATKGNSSAEEMLITYMGEPMPNIAYFFYDKVIVHPNGRRFFPEFFGTARDRLQESQLEKGDHWRMVTGVDTYKFKTLWGDCYIEFSLLGSMVYIISLVFFWYMFFLRKYYLVSMLPLVFYYYRNFLVCGIFSHGFTGVDKHISLLYLILICWIIDRLIPKYRKKIKSASNSSVVYQK